MPDDAKADTEEAEEAEVHAECHSWQWPHIGKSLRIRSSHPDSAQFLRDTLKQTDDQHFAENAQSKHKLSAKVLIVGPKGIGKSSFAMKAFTGQFKSNSDKLDLDQFVTNLYDSGPLTDSCLDSEQM